MKKASVVLKLSISFSVLIAVLMLAFSAFSLILIRRNLNTQNQNEIIDAALNIQQTLEDTGFVIARFETDVSIPWYMLFSVYTKNGSDVSVLSTNDPLLPVLETSNGRVLFYKEKDYFLDGDLELLYYTLEADGYIIQTAINTDLDTLSSFLDEVPIVLILVLIPGILISFILARFMTARTLHPVTKMTEEAKKISFEHNDRRLESSGTKDEFDTLAETFNELFDRLHNDYLREKKFTSDVSHELKTPLSVILGNANILRRWGKDDKAQLDKSIGAILSESKHMENIIKNLLQLSRLESYTESIEKSDIDVKSFLHGLLEDCKSWAEADFSLNCMDGLVFTTNEAMLRQVLIILISNSVRYSDEKPSIKIVVKSAKSSIEISVIDNGKGIKEKDLEHIFDRFYRADEARTRSVSQEQGLQGDGSGLGLEIAKALVTSLGGTITAKSPVKNEKGTEMILRFLL